MEIAIIGSGRVGRALATAAVRAGHTVTLTAANPDHASAVAESIGAAAADSNRAAVDAAGLVVLAVPPAAVASILDDIGEALTGKVLVDPTNPMTAEAYGPALERESGAEFIQAYVPKARVVKAFNTLLASRIAEPVVDGIQLDGFFAGDDAEAKAAVQDLVQSVGFRPMDAGELVSARTLEAMALLNMGFQIRFGWTWQTAWKLLGPTGS